MNHKYYFEIIIVIKVLFFFIDYNMNTLIYTDFFFLFTYLKYTLFFLLYIWLSVFVHFN